MTLKEAMNQIKFEAEKALRWGNTSNDPSVHVKAYGYVDGLNRALAILKEVARSPDLSGARD